MQIKTQKEVLLNSAKVELAADLTIAVSLARNNMQGELKSFQSYPLSSHDVIAIFLIDPDVLALV